MRGLVRVLLPILRLLLRPGLENPAVRQRRIDRLAPLIWRQLLSTRRLVGELTERFLRAQAREYAGVRDPFIPAVSGYSLEAVKTSLDSLASEYVSAPSKRDDVIRRAESTFVRHAEEAGRQMVADAVEPDPDATDLRGDQVQRGLVEEPGSRYPVMRPVDTTLPEKTVPPVVPEVEEDPRERVEPGRRPVAWARMLTGAEDCAFCVMLASRGPVYGSRARALFAGDNPFERYHNNCDCIAVPVYTSKDWVGKAEAARLYDFWLEVTDGFTQGDAINALRRELYRRKKAGEELLPGRVPLREVA